VDVNLAAGTSDRLNVSGTANLAGTVAPHLMSIGAAPQTFTIFTAAGTTNNGLTAQDSAVVDYRLLFPNATDVQIQIAGINFAPSGLTPNQQAVGRNLQQSFLAGGGDLSDLLLSLANEEDFNAFASDLDHLSPEPYLALIQASLWSGFNFSNSLFSCPVPSNGTASLFGEESCYWVRPNGRVASHGSGDGFLGFTERAAGLTGGMQNALAPNWYLDIGFGYERSDIDADTSDANGSVFHGGAALKYIRDRWLIASSVSGSFARYDTSRFGLPTGDTATANADTASLDLRLRLAYAFGSSAFYVKPMVDFDLVGLWRHAIDASGAGALDLHVHGENDWVASAAPAAEFGTEWRHGHLTWRPYVRAGVRFLSQDDFSATANFAGAPAGVPAFTVTSPVDQTLAELSAGFNVWQDKGLSLEVSYDGRFGAHDSENGGAVKLRAAF
jgi:outer membrane autotransporter protein